MEEQSYILITYKDCAHRAIIVKVLRRDDETILFYYKTDHNDTNYNFDTHCIRASHDINTYLFNNKGDT